MKHVILTLSSILMISIDSADALEIASGKASVVNEEPAVRTILQEFLDQALSSSPHVQINRQSPQTINATLVGLRSAALVTLTLMTGETPIRSQKAKILTIEELDHAVPRLLEALILNKKLEDTVERGTALTTETTDQSRLKALEGFHIELAGFAPLSHALGSQDALYSFGLGYSWFADPMRISLQMDLMNQTGDGLDGSGEHKALVWANTINTDYFLYQTRFLGLYVGASVGFANFVVPHQEAPQSNYSYHDNRSNWGFVGGIDAGVELMRHATVSVDIRARALTYAGRISDEVPVILGLGMGIRF